MTKDKKFKPFSHRIGNIAVTNHWVDDDGKKISMQSHLTKLFNYFEIVKYEVNPRFGKESEYERTLYGYKKAGEFGSWDESCFKHKETCYALAFFRNVYNDDSLNVESVGLRPWQLNTEEEEAAFKECVLIGFDYIVKQIAKWYLKDNK